MPRVRLTAKGRRRRVQDARDGVRIGLGALGSTHRANSSPAETSPIGLPAAWRTGRRGVRRLESFFWDLNKGIHGAAKLKLSLTYPGKENAHTRTQAWRSD